MDSTSLASLFSKSSSGAGRPTAGLGRQRLPELLPWGLLAGFLLLIFFLFGDRMLPARSVTVENVVTVRQTSGTFLKEAQEGPVRDPWEAATLFQASGWIEPDPLPMKATALVNGVVETVSVLEGEEVKAGQILASLIDEDFELDLETAQSELASLKGQLEAHLAAIKAAAASLETLQMEVKAGEMRTLELIDRRDRLAKAGLGAVAEGERVSAALMLQTHEAEVDALAAKAEEIRSEEARLKALETDFRAKIRKAETEVSRKQLALDRTVIKAPTDGVILRLLVSPGQKRMLNMDDPDSATVAILYQPDYLQARIDVPLEEASRLGVGQAVRLRSNFLPDRTFEGLVTRIAGEADLQRNTLQVKVRILEPDRRLRPDMLCRAEFLATGTEVSPGGADAQNQPDQVAVYVPGSAVLDRDGEKATAWTLDPSGKHAEKRSIILGPEQRDGFTLVAEGLRPGDRVLTNPPQDLTEGERLRFNPEEKTP